MYFKHVCLTNCIIVFIYSVANSSRINNERRSHEIAELGHNISSLRSLFNDVITQFKKVDKLYKQHTKTADKTDSDNKQIIEIDTSDESGAKVKDTNKSKMSQNTPVYFSDEIETHSETEEKETDVTKTKGDNTQNTDTEHKKLTRSKEMNAFATNNQIKLRNFEDVDKSSTEESSSDEKIVKTNTQYQKKYNKGERKQQNTDLHVSKENKGQFIQRASTEKQNSSESSKILKSNEDIEDSLSEEDKDMQSKISEVVFLRQAYDDACKQVIIRKCFRALRAVSKDICSKGRKCSKKYKDDFRANGQAACGEQFKKQTTVCRMGVDYDEPKTNSPALRATDTKELEAPTTPAPTDIPEVNILRDRYEKACKKASFDKCRAACKNASNKTCKQHECVDAKVKALTKSCKRRCQDTFAYSGGDDSDEEEDEDEDTDEDKDKDTDKDDE